MSKAVLYISYDGMTDSLGQSQVIPYLSGLTDAGYQLHLLSFEKAERAERKPFISQLMKDANIDWHPQPYTKSPPLLSTLKDVRQMRKVAHALVTQHDIQLVHCRSYIAALIGLELKRKRGLKFLFDMRGFWADERVEGGLWNLSNPVFKWAYNYFKKKERQFFTEADHTISLTEAGRDEIHSWDLPNQPVPISVIPCCADLHHFNAENADPQSVAEFRQQLNLPKDQLTLMYLGSIGTWYMLDEMLAFFKRLLAQRPDANFLFITREPAEQIRAAAAAIGVPAERLVIRPAEREELPALLSLADLGIFFIRPTFSKTASSPTKQGEMMALGMPLICNTGVGDTDRVVSQCDAGALISKFTDNDYDAVIDNLDNILTLSKARIKAGAQEWYSLENGVATFREVYAGLIGPA